MDFAQLTRDLDTKDMTIRFAAEALRQRGAQVEEPVLLRAADWLESDQGRSLMLDLSLRAEGEPPSTEEPSLLAGNSAALERTLIVAWLRNLVGTPEVEGVAEALADRIDAGEHTAKTEDNTYGA